MSFPASPLAIVVQIQVGEEWEDITEYVLVEENISISRGRSDWASDVDPGRCSLVLDNRGGRFSPRNPRSPYFERITRNTPLRVGVRHGSQILWRFHGEVVAWPSQWDLSQSMQRSPIEAAGILQRLQAASTPLHSALQRYIMAADPVAYWPLTDGERAQVGLAAVGGNHAYPSIREGDFGSPMRWASVEVAPWLEPIMALPEKTVRGVFQSSLSSGSARPSGWAVDFVRVAGGGDTFQVQVEGAGTDADPSRFWNLGFGHEDQTVFVSYTEIGDSHSSTGQLAQGVHVPEAFDTETPHVYRLEIQPWQGQTAWRICMDGETVQQGMSSVLSRPAIRWLYDWFVPSDNVSEPAALGHVVVWDAAVAPTPGELMLAYHGHSHETAGARIARVCEEAGIPVDFVGDPEETHLVGAQGMMTPLECVREAARADGGILYESRDSHSLTYRTSRSRFNRGRILEDSE